MHEWVFSKTSTVSTKRVRLSRKRRTSGIEVFAEKLTRNHTITYYINKSIAITGQQIYCSVLSSAQLKVLKCFWLNDFAFGFAFQSRIYCVSYRLSSQHRMRVANHSEAKGLLNTLCLWWITKIWKNTTQPTARTGHGIIGLPSSDD